MGGQMSGQAIYESFVNSDMSGLERSGAATVKLSDNYQYRARALARLSTTMQHAWQGEASDAARRGANPLADRYESTLPQLGNATTSIRQQLEAFGTAKSSVVPVPPMPEKPGFFDNVFSLGNASRNHEKHVTAVQNANDHNIAVMTQYENTTRQNADMLTRIPTALQSLPPLYDDGIEERPPSGSPVPDHTTSRVAPPGNGGQSGSGGTSHGGATTTPSPQPQSPSGSSTADTDLAKTGADATQTAASGVISPDIGSPKPAPGPTLDAARPGSSFGPIGVGFGSGADPTRGGVPGGPRGSGAFRGAGAGSVGEPGARTGGLGTRGTAGGESPAGRGTAGRAGASGAGGHGGRGKRGESEDDLEHERPAFLVETDPDELFGSDEATAPPVIGG